MTENQANNVHQDNLVVYILIKTSSYCIDTRHFLSTTNMLLCDRPYLCFVLPFNRVALLSLHVCKLYFQVGHLPHETQLLVLQ